MCILIRPNSSLLLVHVTNEIRGFVRGLSLVCEVIPDNKTSHVLAPYLYSPGGLG